MSPRVNKHAETEERQGERVKERSLIWKPRRIKEFPEAMAKL
jgi:hypothetical protein